MFCKFNIALSYLISISFIFLLTKSSQNCNASSIQIIQNIPKIGIYQSNYKYEIVRVFSETPNSIVVLPILKPNYYTSTTFQLVCNASYPVHWNYEGSGTPMALATTSRITVGNILNKDGESFQARVAFSFFDNTQEGNYSCRKIQDDNTIAFMNLKVGEAGNDNAKIDHNAATRHQNNHEIMTGSSKRSIEILKTPGNPNRIACCSPLSSGHSHFLKIRFLKCTSSSDCNLRKAYMENNHNCTQFYCNQDKVKRLLYNDKKCSILDMVEVDDENYDYADHGNEASNENYYKQGIFQCSAGDETQSKYFVYSKLNDNSIVSDFSSAPENPDNILRIEIQTQISSEGRSKVYLSCEANSFFFSEGIKWAFQSPNDTKLEYYDEANGRVSLVFPKEELDGKTVFCFAPFWNSDEWKSVSIRV